MSNYVEFIKPSYSAGKSVNGKVGAVVLTAEDLNLEGMATEEYVAQKIAEAELNEKEVDLSAYYTKSETDAKIKSAVDAIPEPDLSDYATKAYVSSAMPNLSGYATETYVNTKIAEAALSGEVDLTGYATEEYVDKAIAAIPEVDLKDYAKKSEIPTVPTKVSAFQNDAGYLTEHQSLAGLATETYVTEKIAEAQLGGEEVDLSGYAKTTDIPTKVSQLDNDAGYLTQHQDLSNYALKSEIPDVSGYQTADQVNAAITAALAEIGNAEEGAY